MSKKVFEAELGEFGCFERSNKVELFLFLAKVLVFIAFFPMNFVRLVFRISSGFFSSNSIFLINFGIHLEFKTQPTESWKKAINAKKQKKNQLVFLKKSQPSNSKKMWP